VDRHGFGQCLGAVEVEARENPSRLAAKIFRPHREAGYTSAVVTANLNPLNLLQSGGSTHDPKRTSERGPDGWARRVRVTHCGALRPRAEQQTKRRPQDELCANRGDSEFPQDYRGKPRRGAFRSMSVMPAIFRTVGKGKSMPSDLEVIKALTG
jgi:hypothetical protein